MSYESLHSLPNLSLHDVNKQTTTDGYETTFSDQLRATRTKINWDQVYYYYLQDSFLNQGATLSLIASNRDDEFSGGSTVVATQSIPSSSMMAHAGALRVPHDTEFVGPTVTTMDYVKNIVPTILPIATVHSWSNSENWR